MNTLIHIVDYPQANPWIENQILYLKENGIDQGLVSINSDGELLKNLRKINVRELYTSSFSLINFVCVGKHLKSSHVQDCIILYAHGHKPSVMALILKLIYGLEYVIAHHHPPYWIDMYQKKHRYRGKYHQVLRNIYYEHALAIQSFSSEVDEYLEHKGIPSGKVLHIPLGMDFKRFKEKMLINSFEVNETNNLRILTVSRLVSEKRIDLCLEVAKELSLLGVDFKYSIIGDGPLMKDLLRKRDELRLNDKVYFAGWTNNIDEYFNNHDVLLHLSATESFGQVILEARMHGLPVLTSPCGIAVDMAATGDIGLHLITSLQPNEIATEVARIAQMDKSIDRRLDVFGLYHSQEFFTVQKKLRTELIRMFQNIKS